MEKKLVNRRTYSTNTKMQRIRMFCLVTGISKFRERLMMTSLVQSPKLVRTTGGKDQNRMMSLSSYITSS